MPYQIKNHYKTKDGTQNWRIVWEDYTSGKKKDRHLPKDEWAAAGFHPVVEVTGFEPRHHYQGRKYLRDVWTNHRRNKCYSKTLKPRQ